MLTLKLVFDTNPIKSDFFHEVEEESNTKVLQCYQCGKCSAGCPIAFEMDYLPNQIIRMVQLSMKERALSSRTIWLCAGCETCTTRCPREVDIAKVMDALRIVSLRENVKPSERDVELFNRLFLGTVKKYGRVFEGEMIGKFNISSGHLFKDIFKGPKLFKKGRLKIFPSLADPKKIKEIFKGAESG
ncbi:MAG TPA: heterodisulfide reductase subunit C [bacterium]|nr:heterodisulfide reductase subunit C [bacterium]